MDSPPLFTLTVVAFLLFLTVLLAPSAWEGLHRADAFTELGFVKGKILPQTVTDGQAYPFSFTITNHEGKPMDYAYRVLADGSVVDEETISIPASKEQAITLELKVSGKASGDPLHMEVVLPDLGQQIQQWVTVR
ncbi:MAG: hypothetical protein GXP63_02095 [DPANN group archaeon]|nr:hypothetical protein [DPANN group archaeon]